jgi:hypothetical protein
MQAPSDAERIERREYKYLTDEATAARVREAVRPFCRLDAHGAKKPGGCYTIHSLYFDTPDLALYVANLRELVDRFKLRARTYPADRPEKDSAPVFLEVKRRVNDVILKTRGQVPRSQWARLVEDPGAPIPPSITGFNRDAVERFLALAHTFHAGPVNAVRYEREAWVSQIDHYARVTIDRCVRSQPQGRASLEVEPSGWRYTDHPASQQSLASMTIVELKFTSAVPRWMMHIVQSLDLMRSSFSKYGTSIQAWHEAPLTLSQRRTA